MSPRVLIMRPPTNPVLQVIYILIGGVILIGAVLMGAVLLSIALGVALIVGLVIGIRVWWLRRSLGRAARDAAVGRGRTAQAGERGSTEIIDVEYTVVEQRDDDGRRD